MYSFKLIYNQIYTTLYSFKAIKISPSYALLRLKMEIYLYHNINSKNYDKQNKFMGRVFALYTFPSSFLPYITILLLPKSPRLE